MIRELKADQFVVETKHDRLRILAATDDIGPRRILLVLETGRSVPEKIRRVESSVVADMLFEARPQDSFALLTARGLRKELSFGGSQDMIVAAVKDLQTQTGGDDRGNGMLDALLEGAGWFHEPKPGDAIFLMTLGFVSEHKASYSRVQKELASRQLRLFSLQFTSITAASLSGGLIQFTPRGIDVLASPLVVPNNENVGSLSWGSGGYTVSENILGDAQRDYAVTAEKLEEIKTVASRMHSAIQEYYRLSLDASPSQLTLALAANLRKKIPSAMAIYPSQLPAGCTAQSR